MLGDPPEQLIRGLPDHPVVARQVASTEHRKGIVGERRQHVRTVRSAAWSRNRPRRGLAWLLLVILLLLVALVARVDAAPRDASIALAVRYANLLTGVDGPGEADKTGEADDIDGGSDTDTSVPDVRQPRAYSTDGEAGQRTMLPAEQAPAGATSDNDATLAAAPAGAVETYESWMRPRGPSRWGRLDLGLVWRCRWSQRMHALPRQSEEVWLVATWRR